MTRVMVDAATLARLNNLNGLLEVYDEAGKILGYFHPVVGSPISSPFSQEELQRRRQQRTGRPLSVIMQTP